MNTDRRRRLEVVAGHTTEPHLNLGGAQKKSVTAQSSRRILVADRLGKMTSKQAREEGDLFPFVVERPRTPSPDLPPPIPKRSITPRGPLFPNLDEAHRKITSRLAPNNPFRNASDGSQANVEIPLHEISSATSPDGLDTLAAHGTLRRYASDFVSPHPSRNMAGRSLTDRRSIVKHLAKQNPVKVAGLIEEGNKQCRDEDTDLPPVDTSKSTVERIVEQYATTEGDRRSSSLGSSELAYTFEPPDRQQGAATRVGFRGEENRVPSKHQKKPQRDTSLPPQLRVSETDAEAANVGSVAEALLEAPRFVWAGDLDADRCRLSTTAQLSPSPRVSSRASTQASDADWSKDLDTCGDKQGSSRHSHSLVPQPLRIPSNREHHRANQLRQNPFLTDVESSITGDISTDSNDDPFKYDNEHYRRIRRLGKEREVSRALRRLSRFNPPPEGIDPTVDEATVRAGPDNEARSQSEIHRSTVDHGQLGGNFFDPVAFRALHGDAEIGSGIKIVISKSPEPKVEDETNDAQDSTTFGLMVERDNGNTNTLSRDHATEGDWVTEATSDAGLDTVPHNGPFAQGIKATGSSLADYSDDGYMTHFPGAFGSRDHILQHPSAESLANSYEMHSLKGRDQKVLLPRPNASRFNGFGQNTSRFNSNYRKPTESQEGLFNPFVRRDYKRADASSYFTYKPDKNTRSKYEFRDSTSTYAGVVDSNQAVCGTREVIESSSMASINTTELLNEGGVSCTGGGDYVPHKDNETHQHKHTRRHSRRPTRLVFPRMSQHNRPAMDDYDDKPTPMTPIIYQDGPVSAGSKFSFRLLDLAEAQVLQKQRRESGETDETEDSTVRYNRARSESGTQPSLTPLPPRPSAAYLRDGHVRKGSGLSSTFTPPRWRAFQGDDTPRSTSKYYLLGRRQKRTHSEPRGRLLPLDKRLRPMVFSRTRGSTMHPDPEATRHTEDDFISYQARTRRRLFFYVMLSLCILPFFALLVINGNFDSSLVWFTHGEVSRLTRKQRKIIKTVFVIECVIYASLVAAIIAYYVTASKVHH
ncbi:hypothetical protein JX266_005989 [Neoarthrinium moseri]|nr:hypothetical protein JX266_005989 [Neoarthrinium moseri]